MTCPVCGSELTPAAGRCAVCEAPRSPRVEGALAADPRIVTPPSRGRIRPEPQREGSARKRENGRSWREEVQERVRSRRQKRADAGLPLFDPPGEAPAPTRERASGPPDAVSLDFAPAVPGVAWQPPNESPRSLHENEVARRMAAPAAVATSEHASSAVPAQPELIAPGLSDAELADLPLRRLAIAPTGEARDRIVRDVLPPTMPSLEEETFAEPEAYEPGVEVAPPLADPLPLERPARAGERAQAAAIDAALFAGVGVVAVYFAGRAARVGLETLAGAWPWLAAYLTLLAVYYAGYFTGTTGQTPGKLITGLRVVDTRGRAPSYPRAAARALMGLVGIALGGLGLVWMAFDPAIRALHDRVFRTRVVRH